MCPLKKVKLTQCNESRRTG
uniref:Uncharacterized protein n=1 Tax=Arundo donax TaxID=35708 RepID=A0A0A9H2N6_ARUDO